MKRGLIAVFTVVLLASSWEARADVIIAHHANTDPTAKTFGLWPYNGVIASTAVDDAGQPAWQIANSGSSDEQAFYSQRGGTGPFYPEGSGLTPDQVNAISSSGFVLSLQARIVQGPTYEPFGNELVSVVAALAGFHERLRFDIALASDGQGNTLVSKDRIPVRDFTTGRGLEWQAALLAGELSDARWPIPSHDGR